MAMKLEFSLSRVKINRLAAAFVAALVGILAAASAFGEISQSSDETAAYFGRADEICRDIESVVGVRFKRKVQTAVQSPEAFRDYIRKTIERELGRSGAENCVKAMVKLGLLERPVDLPETYLSLVESQALAHYDPHEKTFFLLMTNMPAMFFDPTASHEMCHALQDQCHDLHAFLERDIEKNRDNGDAVFAKQALVEGEATLVMTLWMIMKQSGVESESLAESVAAVALRMQESMDLRGLVDFTQARLSDMGSDAETMMSAMKPLNDAPRILTEPMMAAYIQGALMVEAVKTRGGWRAVEALFDKPPASSEQVLHPEKIGMDDPIDVRLPELTARLSKSWQLLEQDVAGEMGIRVFYGIWLSKEARESRAAASVAAGWGGDRYCYFENKETGKNLLVWKTVWDSEQEAAEHSAAYRATLRVRFSGAKKAWKSAADSEFKYQVWEVEPGRFLKLAAKDNVVGVIDSTDREALDLMWK